MKKKENIEIALKMVSNHHHKYNCKINKINKINKIQLKNKKTQLL